MRALILLSLAAIALGFPSGHSSVFDDDDDEDCSVEPEEPELLSYTFDTAQFQEVLDPPILSPATALFNNGTHESNIAAHLAWYYTINCNKYPNICKNWCYYVYCKGGSFDVHVNRKANNRAKSACRRPNRCSYNCKPNGGWSKNPVMDLQCDEQPKNTNTEGGAGAATRCMPKSENTAEGNAWKIFMNQQGDKGSGTPLPDGTLASVVLTNTVPSGLCASHAGGKTQCPAPVTPQDKDVKTIKNGHGSDDGIRQA